MLRILRAGPRHAQAKLPASCGNLDQRAPPAFSAPLQAPRRTWPDFRIPLTAYGHVIPKQRIHEQRFPKGVTGLAHARFSQTGSRIRGREDGGVKEPNLRMRGRGRPRQGWRRQRQIHSWGARSAPPRMAARGGWTAPPSQSQIHWESGTVESKLISNSSERSPGWIAEENQFLVVPPPLSSCVYRSELRVETGEFPTPWMLYSVLRGVWFHTLIWSIKYILITKLII